MRGPLMPLWLLVLLAACDDNMADTNRFADPAAPAAVLYDPIPEGSVPRGALARLTAIEAPPGPPDLSRGRERFDIYCSPCHGRTGAGDGIIVRNGFPPPPSFHNPRHRAMEPAEIVAIITNGRGLMASYADRVQPADRWAIAAYVQALQLSQGIPLADLPEEDRARIPPP